MKGLLLIGAAFDHFHWKNPEDYSLEEYLKIPEYLPDGMKIIPYGPYRSSENAET